MKLKFHCSVIFLIFQQFATRSFTAIYKNIKNQWTYCLFLH